MAGIDTSVPQSARIWNYWLGGKDNFPVDRAAGDEYIQTFPGILDIARLTRQFLIRAVRYLAGEAGVGQFLDVGTGLPTVDNTHEVAQRVAPEARIVYVDNDPLVLAHAQALLTGTAQGATDYVDADMREPAAILAAAARTLDLTKPVALTYMGVLGHIGDDDEARSVVRRMMEGLPSGSYLAIADGANEITPEFEAAQRSYDEGGSIPYKLRSRRQVAEFFQGLEILEPGIVPVPQWRPEVTSITSPPDVQPLCGIGRKP
ncbi:MAG TPA: SAM-dependent methyltransferase [Streptosporangiaceae bacterium]|nr:SAM-dependent methyltransferase [Streptosporangiaceae bacterium]